MNNTNNTNNTMTGTCINNKTDESYNFEFKTDLSISDKLNFVNSVVNILVDESNYNSIIRDVMFDFMLIRIMTDINTKDFTLDDIEQFLKDTNVVDIIKANIEIGLLDELNKSVNYGIEYKTGIHINPLSEALTNLINTIKKKVDEFDLSSAMDMVSKFNDMTEDFTIENVVDAYINSDIHKKNLEEVANTKQNKDSKAKLEVIK